MSGNGKRVRDEEELTTGVTLGGAVLLGAKEAAFAEAIVNSRALIEPSEPLVGTMDELVASKSDDQAMVRQLRNTVKKCASCGKMCGWSLAQCNSCGADLPSEVSFSHNLFMGFVYGVGKAPFPLTISIRRQTSELVVFDDILSLSPCHLNVIPTTAFIPDWRFLLRRPAEGLRLICQLEGAAWGCVEEFLKHDAWRTKMLRADPSGKRQQDFRQHVIAGCNFPPSQFQLHIQYFMMPFLPFQYKMYLDGQACKGGGGVWVRADGGRRGGWWARARARGAHQRRRVCRLARSTLRTSGSSLSSTSRRCSHWVRRCAATRRRLPAPATLATASPPAAAGGGDDGDQHG